MKKVKAIIEMEIDEKQLQATDGDVENALTWLEDSGIYVQSYEEVTDEIKEAPFEAKIKTPNGYLMVESKGATDDYPGVFVSFSETGEKESPYDLIACVEYDTGTEEIKTEAYCSEYDEPTHIIQYSDGKDIM